MKIFGTLPLLIHDQFGLWQFDSEISGCFVYLFMLELSSHCYRIIC